jgi:hypothetical protein
MFNICGASFKEISKPSALIRRQITYPGLKGNPMPCEQEDGLLQASQTNKKLGQGQLKLLGSQVIPPMHRQVLP